MLVIVVSVLVGGGWWCMLHVVGTLPDNQFGLRTEEALDCDVCWYEGMITRQGYYLQ